MAMGSIYWSLFKIKNMLKKLYIHQYRTLQNFEISLEGLRSALVLGKNGTGKSSIFDAIEVLQKIGRGITQISQIISDQDFSFGEVHKSIIFELNAVLHGENYLYKLEVELPENVYQPRVKLESLLVEGKTILMRENGRTTLNGKAEFALDWHHVGLPLISTRSDQDPIEIFKTWLANILVLSPFPKLFSTTSRQDTAYLNRNATNLLDWLRRQQDRSQANRQIEDFLTLRMPDLEYFQFETLGKEEKELTLTFKDVNGKVLTLGFNQLSDGEKIFLLTAVLLSSLNSDKPTLCFWDEPDNFVSLAELRHFTTACRKAFENSKSGSQLILSSHNPLMINEFSGHNTLVLSRSSHLQPTRAQWLEEFNYLSASPVEAFENGELG